MKKITAAILILCMCVSVLGIAPVSAASKGVFEYELLDKEAILTYVEQSEDKEITVPKTLGGYPVTSIGDEAFVEYANLESVVIPGCVMEIGDNAFKGCKNLKSVTINDGVESIGDGAFEDCAKLARVELPNSMAHIGDGAFAGCLALGSIDVGASSKRYASVNGVLFNKSKTKLICYPAGKKGQYEIEERITEISGGAFAGCANLSGVKLPATVKIIGDGAFASCQNLQGVIVDGENKNFATEDGILFSKFKTKLIAYPAGKKGPYTVPSSVTEIGGKAFGGCKELTSISLPNSLEVIGDEAFVSCSNKSFENVTIPGSVTKLGKNVFFDCRYVKNLNISSGGGNYTSIDGVVFSKNKKILICYPPAKSGSYKVPDKVTEIAPYAFSFCFQLSGVKIPDSVQKIGEYAFYNCGSLEKVEVTDGITEIAAYAFARCFRLEKVKLPDSVKKIGEYAFYDCSIQEITLPANVDTIGAYAFARCYVLEKMNIPAATTVVEKGLFSGCEMLSDVTIPNKITKIKEYAFRGCVALKKVTIPDSVIEIDERSFDGCETLTLVGTKNLYTEHYARKRGIPFESKERTISVYLNGKNVPCEQPPVIIDGRTLVPLRAIFEAFGAEVSWDGATRTATAKKANRKISVTIDKKVIIIDGMSKEIDVPAQIISDRTMLPVRAVAEAFGCNVSWDASTRTVIITE